MEYQGLLAGLGNPGAKYQGSRHNLGFEFVARLLESARAEELNGARFKSLLWRVYLPNSAQPWLAAMPQTFMNDSGFAIQPLLAWHKLTPDQLVIAHDELDLPPGELRFKFGGGNAGHKGLNSICAQIGSADFYRLRFGIGRPEQRGQVLNWVLGRPDARDAEKIAQVMPVALETFLLFARQGFAEANDYLRTHKASA